MNKLQEITERNKRRQLNIYCNIINRIVMNDIEYYKNKEYAQFFINYNKNNVYAKTENM